MEKQRWVVKNTIGIIFNLYKNVLNISTHNKNFLATRSSNGNKSLLNGINDKREFVPRDRLHPLLVVNCSLQVHENQLFFRFIHKNRFQPLLSAHFPFIGVPCAVSLTLSYFD